MSASRKIATEDIFVARGVRAFAKGDAVPQSVIDNLGVQDKVSGENTKAAKEAVESRVIVPKP